MRDEIINIIKILGVKYNEVMIDIDLGTVEINSLEIRDGDIILHVFIDSMDFEFLFDDLLDEQKKTLHDSLRAFLYN